MLVDLQHSPQDFARFETCLIGKLVAKVEQLGECHCHDLVEIGAVLARFEPVDLAYRQQALHARKHGLYVARIEQLYSDVEEVGPLLREVEGEDLLEGGYELGANVGLRGDEDGHEAVSEGRLLLLRDGFRLAVFFGGAPALGDAVLEVYDSCTCSQYPPSETRAQRGRRLTGQAHCLVLLRLEYAQQGIGEARLFFGLALLDCYTLRAFGSAGAYMSEIELSCLADGSIGFERVLDAPS
jgi:hypothetical protein